MGLAHATGPAQAHDGGDATLGQTFHQRVFDAPGHINARARGRRCACSAQILARCRGQVLHHGLSFTHALLHLHNVAGAGMSRGLAILPRDGLGPGSILLGYIGRVSI